MIVVTTPTGAIGSQVLQGLLDRDAPVRVIVRDPSRLPLQAQGRVEVVQGSHGDSEVVNRAFEGADAVFWLVPPDYRTDSVEASYVDFTRPACEAFTSQGVERVVVVSVLGRGSALADNAGVVTASLAMRDLIAKTGVDYRSLALPSFMSNLLTQVGAIQSQSTFFDVVTGDRKLPTVATRDIAAAAVELLLDDSWNGQDDVVVLGPEDLSCNDMALIMSEVLERPIRYQQVPGEAFKAELLGHGMSEAMAQGLLDMRQAKDKGLDDVEQRTPGSTSPTSFRQWCEEVLKPAVLGQSV
jgi:uncharacterized protein YbjT (DUF2867 family)